MVVYVSLLPERIVKARLSDDDGSIRLTLSFASYNGLVPEKVSYDNKRSSMDERKFLTWFENPSLTVSNCLTTSLRNTAIKVGQAADSAH